MTYNYSFVTGGVEGWNLIDQVCNIDHCYEVLQRTDFDQWVEYPIYAIRVDGEWLNERAQTPEGLKAMKDRIYAMGRVWQRKYDIAQQQAREAISKARSDRHHAALSNWAMF